ncbi:hypothetical protein BBR47_52870 [Brevibacillus brevis NBRC 100599]|uniref:Uncharacterized protein n=1 Tax=Brevibacillus brevis (strain 47 / JCM 6285 / NBRC 100599) TaxID=358681 RepID=C0Z6R5_BREBN|nr:hypothetical protein BBR47_52870 [Brevibacillus brevis NBRC 100599]
MVVNTEFYINFHKMHEMKDFVSVFKKVEATDSYIINCF